MRSQLKGWNKIRAINTYALHFIGYPAGIITRQKEEIEAKDNLRDSTESLIMAAQELALNTR